MSYSERFLAANEKIVETTAYPLTFDDASEFLVHVVARDGLNPGDEVLIEVPRATEPCVLIGGKPLEILIESGTGRLIMQSLETGEEQIEAVITNDETTISPANTLYWYERIMGNALVIRDHCDDFSPSNEPTLGAVVNSLSPVFLGTLIAPKES